MKTLAIVLGSIFVYLTMMFLTPAWWLRYLHRFEMTKSDRKFWAWTLSVIWPVSWVFFLVIAPYMLANAINNKIDKRMELRTVKAAQTKEAKLKEMREALDLPDEPGPEPDPLEAALAQVKLNLSSQKAGRVERYVYEKLIRDTRNR